MKENHPAAVYLGEYVEIKKQIAALQNELEHLRTIASRATTPWGSVPPGRKGGKRDSFASLAVHSVDVEQQLKDLIEKLKESLSVRLKLIEQVEGATEKLILTYRYVNGLNWVQIANSLNYSETSAFDYHRKALERFWNIYQKEGQNAGNNESRSA